MSYTALVPFKDGKACPEVEFRNSWGGAARIWNALFERYVPKRYPHDNWHADDFRLWDLAYRTDLPLFERAALAFTFDLFFVQRHSFARLAGDLRKFSEKYPTQGVDHLPAWAGWFGAVPDFDAAGLHATSVVENPWYRRKKCPTCSADEGEEELIPLSEGQEVYAWLAYYASVSSPAS